MFKDLHVRRNVGSDRELETRGPAVNTASSLLYEQIWDTLPPSMTPGCMGLFKPKEFDIRAEVGRSFRPFPCPATLKQVRKF